MNPFSFFRTRKARLLEEQRRVAMEAYDAAVSAAENERSTIRRKAWVARQRGDDRSVGHYRSELRKATTAALKAEMQLRALRVELS